MRRREQILPEKFDSVVARDVDHTFLISPRDARLALWDFAR